jgi:hypothetical protein
MNKRGGLAVEKKGILVDCASAPNIPRVSTFYSDEAVSIRCVLFTKMTQKTFKSAAGRARLRRKTLENFRIR